MIALFTDFGTRDAYVAQMKGAIVSINPHARLLDLTHDLKPFHIREAAYLLEQSARYFPGKTIFVAVIDPGVGTARRPILVRTRADKYYVGPDNGLFTCVVERQRLAEAYVLQEPAFFLCPEVSATFHGRDIFAPVAAHLSLGVDPTRFGPRLAEMVLLPRMAAQRVNQTIQGEVVHIDRFGNVVTNIHAAWLIDVRPGQRLQVTIADDAHTIPFCLTYAEASPGALVCLVNSDAAFEVAVSQGNASERLRVQVGDPILLNQTTAPWQA